MTANYMFGDLDGESERGQTTLSEPSPLVPPPVARGETGAPETARQSERPAVVDTPPPGWKSYGRGTYLQTLLQLRLWTDDQLVAAVHAYYANSRTGPADVKFNASLIARRVGVKPAMLRVKVEQQELLPPPPWDPWISRFAGEVIQDLGLQSLLEYVNGADVAARVPGNSVVPPLPFKVTPAEIETAQISKTVTINDAVTKVDGALNNDVQPSRFRKSVDPNREFDKTSLREASHGQWIMRDYFSHAMRWSHAGRYISAKTDVLDVGCGPDVQLINVLTMPRNQVPKSYVGVDLNREPKRHPNRGWATLHWGFNFIERYQELGQFDVVTCYEMLEHVHREDGFRLLNGLKACLRKDGLLFLSTPVYNGRSRAANHIVEWTIAELAAAFQTVGLNVVRRFGTFASAPDLRKAASEEDLRVLERLEPYYSAEIMACIISPLYPDHSRNNIWIAELPK